MKLWMIHRIWRRPHPDMASDELMGGPEVNLIIPVDDLLASYLAGFYRCGYSIEDIARASKLSLSTVRKYLALANDLIPPEEHMPAHEAGQQRGRGPVRQIMLGGVLPPRKNE